MRATPRRLTPRDRSRGFSAKRFVGKALFHEYKKTYGARRATEVARLVKRSIKEKSLRSLEKSQERRIKRGEITLKKAYIPPARLQFRRAKGGKYRVIVNGKRTDKILTKSGAKRLQRLESDKFRERKVAFALNIKPKEARKLIRAVTGTAASKLRAFKKTAYYKKLSPRKKRAYNVKRERAKFLDLFLEMVELESP